MIRRLSLVLLGAALVWSPGCQKNGAPGGKLPITTTKGGVEMVLIPAGTFSMGNRQGKEDEQAVHTVSLAAFWMDRTEVTQAEYERLGARIALPNDSHFKAPDQPVEMVKWGDAARYCNERSKDDGLKPCYNEDTAECNFDADGYRLPTEAEWEYACRAGTTTDYSFGNDPRDLEVQAWFANNSEKKTHPVGQKNPNPWGLFDMHGNVAEWCNDMYDKNYYQSSPAENPRGPKDGKLYVLRGGSWKSGPEALRSSYRLGEIPGFSDTCLAPDAIGFRCVRQAAENKASSQ